MKNYILFLFAIVLLGACNSGFFSSKISEGVVEYTVSYPNIDPDNILSNVLPEKMIFTFKDNRFNSEMSAGMGMFKTNFIVNSDDYQLIHLVKLMNDKYATKMDQEIINQMNKAFENAEIIDTKETKTIAGHLCKKALVVFEELDFPEAYVYYTEDIKFKDPNWTLPYKKIPGVMLEYEIEQYDIRMKFTATKVVKASVDDSVFEMPEDYSLIPHKEVEREVNALFESLQ